MIAIESRMFIKGLCGEEIFDFLMNATDKSYRRWWPGTHLRLHALKRSENHVGDVFYMDEYVGGRRLRMRGVVVEAERGTRIVWRFELLGVYLPARLILETENRAGGVAIRHEIQAGFNGPGRILDPLFRLYFSERFARDMDEHAHAEFPMLRDLLAKDPEAGKTPKTARRGV